MAEIKQHKNKEIIIVQIKIEKGKYLQFSVSCSFSREILHKAPKCLENSEIRNLTKELIELDDRRNKVGKRLNMYW